MRCLLGVALYLAIAFALAWACQIPVYGTELDGPIAIALLAIGGIAPSIAAVVVTRGKVWRETWRGPAPIRWILGAFVAPSVLVLLTGLASGSLSFTAPNLGAVLLPPIGEELGWRGYLQPKLCERFSLAPASLMTGAIWALWHLPTAIGHFETFPGYAFAVTCGALAAGYLWEHSGRSTLVAIAFHAGLNLSIVHASRPAMVIAWSLVAIATTSVATSIRRARRGSLR